MENVELEKSVENAVDWQETKEPHPLSIQNLDQYENDPWAQPNNENDVLTKHDTLGEQKTHIKPIVIESNSKEPTKASQIPQWLTGEHFTIGPGTFDVKYNRKIEVEGEIQLVSALYTFGHWFDALPLVNRFDLNGQRNTITYRNKLTNKRLIEKIRDHHGYSPLHPAGLYMSSTNQTVLSKILKNSTKPNKPDAEPCSARILTKIPGLNGRLFCQNHANHIQELDPFDLKPTSLFTWSEINPLFKGTSSCPNGQYDSHTGEYINYTMEVGYQSIKYHFFSISDQNSKGTLITSLSAPMAYVNTFSITPKYIIFVIHPMLANANGVKYNWCESLMDSFSFKPSEPTLFYVISRERKELAAVYRSDPCFIMNHINAYEEQDMICLDMICYNNDTIARQLNTEFLRNPQKMEPSRLMESEIRRYKLPSIEQEAEAYQRNKPSKSRLTSILNVFKTETTENYSETADNRWYSWMPTALYDQRVPPSVELPQINPRLKMYKHNIMYGLGFSASSSLKNGAIWDSIVKINLETRAILTSWYQEGCYPSEAVFVPRPSDDPTNEDDGVLLSVVMNASTNTSFLLVLDATDLHVLAIADLERLVPISFAHGDYRLLEKY